MLESQPVTPHEARERIRKVLIEEILIDGEVDVEGKANPHLYEDLGMDQTEIADLSMALETEFDLEIEDKFAEEWSRLSHAVDTVVSLSNGEEPD